MFVRVVILLLGFRRYRSVVVIKEEKTYEQSEDPAHTEDAETGGERAKGQRTGTSNRLGPRGNY